MVKRACEKSGGIASSDIAGAVANAKQGLPFKGGVFQVVFSLRFFHHLHEKQARTFILNEFSRVSKGWVVLSFYQVNFLHKIQRQLRRKVNKSSTRIYQVNFLHKIQRQLRRKVNKSSTRIKMLLAEEFAEEIEQAGLKPVRIISLFKGLHSQHIALLKKKITL
jgi:ubiquinone/menaquinone biosynthesis C-methylase UbiE